VRGAAGWPLAGQASTAKAEMEQQLAGFDAEVGSAKK